MWMWKWRLWRWRVQQRWMQYREVWQWRMWYKKETPGRNDYIAMRGRCAYLCRQKGRDLVPDGRIPRTPIGIRLLIGIYLPLSREMRRSSHRLLIPRLTSRIHSTQLSH